MEWEAGRDFHAARGLELAPATSPAAPTLVFSFAHPAPHPSSCHGAPLVITGHWPLDFQSREYSIQQLLLDPGHSFPT